jgi:hypothetical protein
MFDPLQSRNVFSRVFQGITRISRRQSVVYTPQEMQTLHKHVLALPTIADVAHEMPEFVENYAGALHFHGADRPVLSEIGFQCPIIDLG